MIAGKAHEKECVEVKSISKTEGHSVGFFKEVETIFLSDKGFLIFKDVLKFQRIFYDFPGLSMILRTSFSGFSKDFL